MSLFLIIIFNTNCKKETDYTNHLANSTSANFEKDRIVLGKKLNNPYSIENMQEAYSNLKGNGHTESGGNLSPTHLYIRYLPANDAEYQILKDDQDLELFDYPLDYEMEEGGLSYHDPNLPDSVITWQYSAITINHPIANLEYEIIDSLVIPEFYESESFTPEFLSQLEREAFKITGNLEEGMVFSPNTELLPKWHPEEKIQIHDDMVGSSIPLEGVKVRARSWFKIRVDYTDENGNFQTARFRNKVNYSIKWETKDYDIRNGRFLQAYYNGPKQIGDWNLDINSTAGKSLRFGTIHRAAYRYYFGDIGTLKRPGTLTNLKLKYIDNLNTTVYFPGTTWKVHTAVLGSYLQAVKIWKGVGSSIAKTHEMFSTTIHEIGHASHKKLIGGVQMVLTKPIIRESWANAIEWYITKKEYNDLGVSDYDEPDGLNDVRDHIQHWRGSPGLEYSPIFIDLVDDYNQSLENGVYNSFTQEYAPFPIYCSSGTMDGSGGCLIATAPFEESAHIYEVDNHAQYFYYTPVGCCGCPVPGSGLVGNECQVLGGIPHNVVPYVVANRMYYRPKGNPKYYYDEVFGFTMGYIETVMLPNIKTFGDLEDEAHDHQPTVVNPNATRILFEAYKNDLNL